MKKILVLMSSLLLCAAAASAATTTQMQKWTAGWDNGSEPLNYTKSNINWTLDSTTRELSVKFMLVGATPRKLYQVGITFFCNNFPGAFGQFTTHTGAQGNCTTITRRGVTESQQPVELGVVTTDSNGDGSFSVVIGPINAGTYVFEFMARDGAGCGLTGGASNGTNCNVDFQSPGPFRTATKITIP